MPAPLGYSRTQIALHWVVAGLLVLQFVLNETISRAFDAAMKGQDVSMSLLGAQHVLSGIVIFVLVLWRIVLRRKHGVPELPESESALLQRIAHLTHFGLYALLLLAAASGGMAWFGMVEAAGEMHELFTKLLMILTALHIAGALYHQFILKTNLIDRMRSPKL